MRWQSRGIIVVGCISGRVSYANNPPYLKLPQYFLNTTIYILFPYLQNSVVRSRYTSHPGHVPPPGTPAPCRAHRERPTHVYYHRSIPTEETLHLGKTHTLSQMLYAPEKTCQEKQETTDKMVCSGSENAMNCANRLTTCTSNYIV